MIFVALLLDFHELNGDNWFVQLDALNIGY
jgi:hypothetical protein